MTVEVNMVKLHRSTATFAMKQYVQISIGQFRSALKTHLFNRVVRLVTLVFSRAV